MADQELHVFTTAAAMRQFTRDHRRAGRTVALVPTMVRDGAHSTQLCFRHQVVYMICRIIALLQGNLHDGHISLITAAR
jgi:pantothenate synthetase